MEEHDTPIIESCISVAGDEWRYTPDEIAVLAAELAELRRKAALTDRLADEVLDHRTRRVWNESFGATSETAQKRAYDSMVREGLVP